MIISYLFFVAFCKCFAFAQGYLLPPDLEALVTVISTEEFKNQHEGLVTLEIVDSLSYDHIDLKNSNEVFNNIMFIIMNEMTKMKECLMRRQESISLCLVGVEESIRKVMKWTDQVESVKPHSSVVTDVYHKGISDPDLESPVTINSTEEFKKEHEGSLNLDIILKVLNNIMLNILNKTKKMKECLLRRKKSIVLESISVCSTVVENYIMKVMKWKDLTPNSSGVTDVYHPGISDPAVLITGGLGTERSAEIYHPDRIYNCVLPDLPERLYGHTQDGSLLCGGWYTRKSCWKWNPANTKGPKWYNLAYMNTEKPDAEIFTVERMDHTSWTPADGSVTYLIGGWDSGNTTEVIKDFSGHGQGFHLQHNTVYACSIPDPDTDTVVVTGGKYTLTTVSRYDKEGFRGCNSILKTGRFGHGCSSFISKDNERVLLVTGGYDYSAKNALASTEVYRPSAGEWREVPEGALPRPMKEVLVITLNNRVLLFGGLDNQNHADILKFSESEEKWTKIGEMSQPRSAGGVSVVSFDEFKNYCQ